MAKQVEVALAPLQLSLAQYRVLTLLARGAAGSSVVADQLAIRRPSVTGVVDGLVGRGLVERRPDPDDRRRHVLVLTASGAQLLAAADGAIQAGLVELASYVGPPGRAVTERTLGQWAQALDQRRAVLRAAEESR